MDLTNLGITNEEYKTYIEILKEPPIDIVSLAEKTKIKRSTLYSILDKLQDKGLIYKPKDSKYRYIASPPEKLLKYAKRNKEKVNKEFKKLKEQIPLMNIFNITNSLTSQSEYYVYKNDESMFFMTEIVAQSKGQMLGLSNHHWLEVFRRDKNNKVLPSKYLDTVMRVGDRFAFTGTRKARDEAKRFLKKNSFLVGKWEPRWIDKSKFDFAMNINTFDDKILFTVPGKDPFSLQGWTTHYFRNKEIAKAIQRLFQYIWENAEDLT